MTSTSPDSIHHSEFFRTYAPRLQALVKRRLGSKFRSRFDAEDVVQSAFRSFFIRYSTPANSSTVKRDEDSETLWPLLAEITVCKLAALVRRHTALKRNVGQDASIEWAHPEHTQLPDESLAIQEIIELTKSELDSLAGQAFLMRLDGLEVLEIAEELQVSERTIRRYIQQAKASLQLRLQAQPRTNTPPTVEGEAQIEQGSLLNFDDYRLNQWIGDGAVGNVYRATEKETGRKVAIKFLKKSFHSHPQAIASFYRELAVVSKLDHPGILAVQGIGKAVLRRQAGLLPSIPSANEARRSTFLVLDWAEKGDLLSLSHGKRPDLEHVQIWICEIADTLHHAHQAGIVHCDLKPSNILINNDGRLLVGDFGLARSRLTWNSPLNPIGGTPAYLAPELLDPTFGPLGPATDVFGLGAILFQLLTGCPIFHGRNVDQILGRIISSDPIEWPVDGAREIPIAWRECCRSMLEKKVHHRIPDMATARRLIEKLPVDFPA